MVLDLSSIAIDDGGFEMVALSEKKGLIINLNCKNGATTPLSNYFLRSTT